MDPDTSLSDFPQLVAEEEDIILDQVKEDIILELVAEVDIILDQVNCQHLESQWPDHRTLSEPEGLRGVKILVYHDGRLAADSNRKLWRRHNLTIQISTFPHLIGFPSDPSSRGRTQ